MAQTFTIESIEGNSYIGVPVFSRMGHMQNYNYLVLSPQKKDPLAKEEPEDMIDKENLKYKIQADEPKFGVGETEESQAAL